MFKLRREVGPATKRWQKKDVDVCEVDWIAEEVEGVPVRQLLSLK